MTYPEGICGKISKESDDEHIIMYRKLFYLK